MRQRAEGSATPERVNTKRSDLRIVRFTFVVLVAARLYGAMWRSVTSPPSSPGAVGRAGQTAPAKARNQEYWPAYAGARRMRGSVTDVQPTPRAIAPASECRKATRILGMNAVSFVGSGDSRASRAQRDAARARRMFYVGW